MIDIGTLLFGVACVIIALIASGITAWVLHRYSLIAPANRDRPPWYMTWRRVVVLALGAFLIGLLSQLAGTYRGFALMHIFTFMPTLFYPQIGVRRWILLLEQTLLWLVWTMGVMSIETGSAALEPTTAIGCLLSIAVGQAGLSVGRILLEDGWR
ncbi:MAG: hypothetical protein HOM68_20625 [Gemmatimonadetes bacterium]|nr:hypothetical protein [Gemmatimonadota bacterium]MBT4613269.1 hypothetical protein [Gemmatimonadota bacterium]MBT5058960.1 hypothetical protein [Gemmatimonadota bacterium]MBT5142914.1 hypothetical protein [Gemmatimonadota bacterium]MBT5589508.1 hypothetical protein [Gemmatimonadota bacterium]